MSLLVGWIVVGRWVVGQKEFWPTKIEAPKKLGPKSLVKIGSVRSEILLLWTNVPMRNVAWTNVMVGLAKKIEMSKMNKN